MTSIEYAPYIIGIYFIGVAMTIAAIYSCGYMITKRIKNYDNIVKDAIDHEKKKRKAERIRATLMGMSSTLSSKKGCCFEEGKHEDKDIKR